MHEPPRSVTDGQVLGTVRTHWDDRIDRVEHLGVGFGAWHWRGSSLGEPLLFLTLDPPLWHDADSLEATYRGAAALAEHLEVVHPPLPTAGGRFTVPLGEGRLSCTRWVPGSVPARFSQEAADAVRRIHRTPPPPGLRTWRSQVDPGLVDRLHEWSAEPWTGGPLGERARHLVRGGLLPLTRALSAHQELAERLDPDEFVTSHGEPGVHNQWRTTEGRLLFLDWETLARAPRERDLLGGAHERVDHDPDLLRFFQLEWSLTEVAGYADWLRGPHAEDADTRIALSDLGEEIGAAAREGLPANG